MRSLPRSIRLTTLVLVAASAAPPYAAAQDGTAQARAEFDQGAAHHRDGRFVLAAESFQRAYELLRRAGEHHRAAIILFNLGTSLDEIAGREREARDAYAGFLREAAPDSPEFMERGPTVRARMAELDARLAASQPTPPSLVGPVVLIATGCAFAIAGGVSLAVALVDEAALENPEDGATWDQATADRVPILGASGVAGLAVGASLAGAALVWLLVSADDSAAVGLTPTGMRLRGRF